jgi:hypothetical protein
VEIRANQRPDLVRGRHVGRHRQCLDAQQADLLRELFERAG